MSRTSLACVLVLTVAVLAVYAPGLHAPPMHDDVQAVLGNPLVADPDPARLLEPPPHRHLTTLSFAVNAALSPAPWALRAGNILIHLIVALLAGRVASRCAVLAAWQGPDPGPWTTLFVALHPMAVQAVTYLSQRACSLEALLALLSMDLYLGARITGSSRRWWGALAAAAAAMTAKETAVTLPLSLGAIEWVTRAGSRTAAFRRWSPFAALAILTVAGAAHLVVRADEEGSAAATATLEASRFLMLQPPLLLRYMALTVLPFPMRFLFDNPTVSGPEPALLPGAVLGGALLLAAGIWILAGSRRHALPRLGLALFLAPLALESAVPLPNIAWCYRCYPGLFGAGMALGALVAGLGAARGLAGAAVLALLGLGATAENRLWGRPGALLARDVRQAFHDGMAWNDYGVWRRDAGDPSQALHLHHQALRSPWKAPRMLTAASLSLQAAGRTTEAVAQMDRALETFPRSPGALWEATRQAQELGDADRVGRLAARAGARDRLHPEMLVWLGQFHARAGRLAEAEAVLLRHLPWAPPGCAHRVLNDLGVIAMKQGRLAEAEARFRESLRLKPGHPRALENLDRLRAAAGGRLAPPEPAP